MKDRYRLFTLVLYEESDKYNFKDVLKNIKSYKFYAYIKHNKDVFDDGTDKQVHYHFEIVFSTNGATKSCSCSSHFIFSPSRKRFQRIPMIRKLKVLHSIW